MFQAISSNICPSRLHCSNKIAQENTLIIYMDFVGCLMYVNTLSLLRGFHILIFYFIPETFFSCGLTARMKFQNKKPSGFYSPSKFRVSSWSVCKGLIQQNPGITTFAQRCSLSLGTVPIKEMSNRNQL